MPLLALILGTLMAMIDSTIVNVAIPTMITQFGATPDEIQWVVTVFLLVLGVVVPVSAWLGDRFGLTQVYVASLGLFTLGSALCGLSWSLPALVGFRVLQGVGGGLMMPLTMAIVYRIVPRDRIGTAMGFYGIAYAAGPALGPTLGGYLVQYVDWRAIFWVNVPLGILTMSLALAVLPRFPAQRRAGFDTPGFVTSAAGLGLLFLALSEGQSWGWGSASIVLLLVAGLWLLVLFTLIELQSPHPLIDVRLFRHTVFTLSILLVMICTIALYAADFFVPLFMQRIQGHGALATGLTLLPSGLAMAVFMPLAGRAYDRVGARVPVTIGMIGLVAASLLFNRLEYATAEAAIAAWMIVRNVALGIAWMPSATAGISVVPVPDISRASALNNICSRIASAMGLAVLTSAFTSAMAQRTSDMSASLTHFNRPLGVLLRQSAATAGRAMQPALPAVGPGATGFTAVLQAVEARAFADAVHQVFAFATILSLGGIGLAILLRERRHRPAGAQAPPRKTSTSAEAPAGGRTPPVAEPPGLA